MTLQKLQTPSQAFPRLEAAVSSHKPSESRGEEVLQGAQRDRTVISLVSMWGWALCGWVPGQQNDINSSPAPAGPIPCSWGWGWGWGWPAAPSQHTPLPVPWPHQPLPAHLGHIWDTFGTRLAGTPPGHQARPAGAALRASSPLPTQNSTVGNAGNKAEE